MSVRWGSRCFMPTDCRTEDGAAGHLLFYEGAQIIPQFPMLIERFVCAADNRNIDHFKVQNSERVRPVTNCSE